ncbi:hypothetical protein Q4551_02890 [Oceanobacter sp. 5_MG-2023]|uniref:hypothetical protein n=1 Tax=Oceanobacter sp. 5_MG-2023 TaxID=3062645 RepID=UPI0026E1AFE3|nr:hypothetical protein [Oceanobacter sp. 5_MG-2023]MDO6681223.1 hypothetical protein [Oceanobacter sp. 5_MG-2023]
MSVTYAIWTVVVALLTCPLTVSAAKPDIGSSFNGGDFLYREAVEMYWNDWVGFPVMAADSGTSNRRITVVGEGKAVDFIGNLSINCENRQNF